MLKRYSDFRYFDEIPLLVRCEIQREVGVVVVDHCTKIGEAAVVVEATFHPCEQAAEWRCPVLAFGRTARLEVVEQLLSQAYVPLLSQFVRVFTQGLSAKRVNDLMRQAGKSLAEELLGGKRPSGNLKARVTFVSQLMNEQLGAATHVEGNGKLVIRGAGCPVAALTGKHPAVCVAMESFVSEVVDGPARECCDRSSRPRCCFEVGGTIREAP